MFAIRPRATSALVVLSMCVAALGILPPEAASADAGDITEFPGLAAGAGAFDIAPGPDGNLWFAEANRNNIGRITTSGTIKEFPVQTGSSDPFGITTGPDGNLWFAELAGDLIGRVLPSAASVLVLPAGPVPATISSTRGGTVAWTFLGPGTHSVIDTSGMGLFDSGARSFVTYFPFRFVAAGSYAYEDTANAAAGTVQVPMKVKPTSGHISTKFTVTWAAAAPPAGYVFDVQIKRPGAGFVTWQDGVTTLNAKFTPDGGLGKYSFRARLRRTSNGATSGFSAAFSITVS